MALKHKVEDITSVPEAFRGEYTEQKEGDKTVFVLNVEGLPQPEDVSGLKRTVEALRNEKREALDKAEKLGQDITSLRTFYDDKIAAVTTQAEEAAKNSQEALRSATIGETVTKLSVALSDTNSKILAPHIEKRLRVDLENGKPLVRVLDEKGGLTDMSINDLENEFRANKDFAGVVTATRASGSGAGGERHIPGGAGGGSVLKHPGSMASPKALADFADSLPD